MHAEWDVATTCDVYVAAAGDHIGEGDIEDTAVILGGDGGGCLVVEGTPAEIVEFADRVRTVVHRKVAAGNSTSSAARHATAANDLCDVIEDLRKAVTSFDIVIEGDPASGGEHGERAAAVELVRAAETAIATIQRSLSPEDTCKAGDPDPTPKVLDEGSQCGAWDDNSPFRFVTLCTRYRGHAGRQHVSGDGARVKYVWPWRPTGEKSGDSR